MLIASKRVLRHDDVLCDRGDLQHFRISNAIRISADELAAFIEAQRTRP